MILAIVCNVFWKNFVQLIGAALKSRIYVSIKNVFRKCSNFGFSDKLIGTHKKLRNKFNPFITCLLQVRAIGHQLKAANNVAKIAKLDMVIPFLCVWRWLEIQGFKSSCGKWLQGFLLLPGTEAWRKGFGWMVLVLPTVSHINRENVIFRMACSWPKQCFFKINIKQWSVFRNCQV